MASLLEGPRKLPHLSRSFFWIANLALTKPARQAPLFMLTISQALPYSQTSKTISSSLLLRVRTLVDSRLDCVRVWLQTTGVDKSMQIVLELFRFNSLVMLALNTTTVS